MKIVATKKGLTTNFFYPSLFFCCFWIRGSEIRDPEWVKIRGSATLLQGAEPFPPARVPARARRAGTFRGHSAAPGGGAAAARTAGGIALLRPCQPVPAGRVFFFRVRIHVFRTDFLDGGWERREGRGGYGGSFKCKG